MATPTLRKQAQDLEAELEVVLNKLESLELLNPDAHDHVRELIAEDIANKLQDRYRSYRYGPRQEALAIRRNEMPPKCPLLVRVEDYGAGKKTFTTFQHKDTPPSPGIWDRIDHPDLLRAAAEIELAEAAQLAQNPQVQQPVPAPQPSRSSQPQQTVQHSQPPRSMQGRQGKGKKQAVRQGGKRAGRGKQNAGVVAQTKRTLPAGTAAALAKAQAWVSGVTVLRPASTLDDLLSREKQQIDDAKLPKQGSKQADDVLVAVSTAEDEMSLALPEPSFGYHQRIPLLKTPSEYAALLNKESADENYGETGDVDSGYARHHTGKQRIASLAGEQAEDNLSWLGLPLGGDATSCDFSQDSDLMNF